MTVEVVFCQDLKDTPHYPAVFLKCLGEYQDVVHVDDHYALINELLE